MAADSEYNNRGEEIRRRTKTPNAINISNSIRHSSSGSRSSRSSTIGAVCRQDLAGVQKYHDDDDDDNDDEYDNDVKTNNTKIRYYWILLVRKWKQFTSYIYNSIVIFVAEFISNILSQPNLQDLLCEIIVRAINAFMDQDDIGAKMDDTARRVLYDRDKAKHTAKALGKEVVPMVSGFVGGVASSFTPSVLKKRNRQQKQKKKNKDRINNGSKDSSALIMSGDFTLDDLDEEEGEEEHENANTNTNKDPEVVVIARTTTSAPSPPAPPTATNSAFLSFKKSK